MEELRVRLNGQVPILLHNNQAANPLNAYAKALKALTGKRKKTDEDIIEIMRLEWEAGLYLQDGIVALPSRMLNKCFLRGARRSKNGIQYETGVMIREIDCTLIYKGPQIKVNGTKTIPNRELDKYFEHYHDVRMVKVGKNLVPRCRPIFEEWAVECTLDFDSTEIDRRTLLQSVIISGKTCGLGDMRPQLGRFEATEL